jgi:hypothetical protein
MKWMDFRGNTVWITMTQPFIWDESSKEHVQTGQYVVAFNIGVEPKVFAVDYVVDENGKPKFFPDTVSAICAAQEAARKKINANSN